MIHFPNAPRAGLSRRLAAWVYDLLVGLAIYMVAGALFFALFVIGIQLGLISGQEHPHAVDALHSSPVWSAINEVVKLLSVAALFCWFWIRSGQTLGMRAWRLRVQNLQGYNLVPKQAWLRVALSLGGLVNLSLIFSQDNMAIHDRISGSEVVELTLEQNRDLTNKKT